MKEFFELKGKTISSWSPVPTSKSDNIQGDDQVDFVLTDGTKCSIYHNQDCCEVVQLVKVIGDPTAVLGQPIKVATDDHPDDPEWMPEYKDLGGESYTWTRYQIITESGVELELWFIGESNGYYSETMSFGGWPPKV